MEEGDVNALGDVEQHILNHDILTSLIFNINA